MKSHIRIWNVTFVLAALAHSVTAAPEPRGLGDPGKLVVLRVVD